MTKDFKALNDNDVFKMGDVKFKKIPVVRVSCCKALNAEQVDNPSNRIFVPPQQSVEVDE